MWKIIPDNSFPTDTTPKKQLIWAMQGESYNLWQNVNLDLQINTELYVIKQWAVLFVIVDFHYISLY